MHSASYTGLTVESVCMGHQSVLQDPFLELNKNRINTSFTTMPTFRSKKAAGFVASRRHFVNNNVCICRGISTNTKYSFGPSYIVHKMLTNLD